MNRTWPGRLPPILQADASLKRLTASVAVARGLAATGRPIDLSGLESAAGLFCAQAMDLEPRDGAALRPAIVALDDSIQMLMRAIQPARQ